MRHKRLSRAEEKAYSLPAKLAIPMMVSRPARRDPAAGHCAAIYRALLSAIALFEMQGGCPLLGIWPGPTR
jgi:hypothetical protein